MRKLRVSILLTIVALLMLLPMMKPTQQVKGFSEESTTEVYDIPCKCRSVSPSAGCPGTLAGAWHIDCYGNESGWGLMPGEPCTYSVFSSIPCGPDTPSE
jgi:hypothetical protein